MKAPFTARKANMTLENQENQKMRDNSSKDISVVKQSSNKVCIFGTGLDILMGNLPNQTVPYVITRLCCYIEKHGLLQTDLLHKTEKMSDVDYLKKEFDESGDASLESRGNVAAAMKLLELFFEELPEPLIPASMHDAFFDVKRCILSSGDCIKHLKSLVDLLPGTAFCVLKYLSHFLQQIAKHGDCNGLSSINLSVMFGPIIFRPHKKDPLLRVMIKNITNYFVADYDAIFEKTPLCRSQDLHTILFCDFYPLKKHRQASLLPSSVGPVLPMEPLEVLIPPMDSNTENNEKSPEMNHNYPIMIKKNVGNINDNDAMQKMKAEDESLRHKIKLALPGTRKRKETLLMADNLSESFNKVVEPVMFEIQELETEVKKADKKDHPLLYSENPPSRTCEIHTENLDQTEQALPFEHNRHSPHPPDPKRRELEALDYEQNLLNEKYRTHHRNFIKYYKDKKSGMTPKCFSNPIVKKGSFDTDRSIQLNLNSQSVEKLPPKACLKDAEPDDCFMPIQNAPSDEDAQNTCVTEIARPVSCPVSIKEEDTHTLESEHPSLSLSWSRLFDVEEPVLSGHRHDWSYLKNSDEETEILSPSVYELRKSNSFEAPLSPSAFKSYLSHKSIDLDSNVAPSPPIEQEHFRKSSVKEESFSSSIKQLTKKIHGLKKKIKRFDEKYEIEYGYKPSHAEKMNFPDAKKLLNDLHKARKELKALKEESHMLSAPPTSRSWLPSRDIHILEDTTNCLKDCSKLPKDHSKKSKPFMQKFWGDSVKSLDDDRKLANRPELIEDMTKDQVKDEKLAIQKMLLQFESIHGKPSKKSDRDTVRPLYERYRNIKRLLVRSSSFPVSNCKSTNNCNGLQPIMEHEAMDFNVPQEEQKLDNEVEEEVNTGCLDAVSQVIEYDSNTTARSLSFQFLDNKYNNSNLHELPLPEMVQQQHIAKMEKRRLRKILREFESEFMKANGRKIQKEDKAPVETLYEEYRLVKARLRLLEALISKHHEHQNE